MAICGGDAEDKGRLNWFWKGLPSLRHNFLKCKIKHSFFSSDEQFQKGQEILDEEMYGDIMSLPVQKQQSEGNSTTDKWALTLSANVIPMLINKGIHNQ